MRLTRRALLLAGCALPLPACTGDVAPPPRPAPVDPDDALRAAARTRETDLLARYDAAAAALPSLGPLLALLRAEHAEHLAALGGTDPGRAAVPTPAVPVPGSAVTPSAPAPSPAAALAALSAAETAAAREHGAAALTAASGDLAGVLGQLSASEGSHPLVLR